MNPEIVEIRNQIEELQTKLRTLMHNCQHINAKLYHSKGSGSYYDDPSESIYVVCDDCGINYTYDEDDKMFKILKERL